MTTSSAFLAWEHGSLHYCCFEIGSFTFIVKAASQVCVFRFRRVLYLFSAVPLGRCYFMPPWPLVWYHDNREGWNFVQFQELSTNLFNICRWLQINTPEAACHSIQNDLHYPKAVIFNSLEPAWCSARSYLRSSSIYGKHWQRSVRLELWNN